jgi:transcriptional regulator with XRE-family HTH domain
MGEAAVKGVTAYDFYATKQDVGRILMEQRNRLGLSQGDIAKALGYVNVNFISMLESGKSKIPVNKIDELVVAYHLPTEFILVILRVMYPDYFETIHRVTKKAPRIFKKAMKDPDEGLFEILENIKSSLKIK